MIYIHPSHLLIRILRTPAKCLFLAIDICEYKLQTTFIYNSKSTVKLFIEVLHIVYIYRFACSCILSLSFTSLKGICGRQTLQIAEIHLLYMPCTIGLLPHMSISLSQWGICISRLNTDTAAQAHSRHQRNRRGD
jgi:hypothetical protein